MPETKRRRSFTAACIIAVAILVGFAVKRFRDNRDMPWSLISPGRSTAAVTRMFELRDKGQFEDAINVGLHATNGSPDDAFVYQMIATTYFMRSLHDKDHSGNWAKLGAEYWQKALDSNPNDIANVLNVGLNFVAAGDDTALRLLGSQEAVVRLAANVRQALTADTYVGDNSTSSERPKATRDTRKVMTMNPIMRRIGMPAIARRGRAKNG